MTAIAYRRGVIAADRRVLSGDTLRPPACKIHKGRTAHYRFALGFAGNDEGGETILALAEEIVETRKRPRFAGHLEMIIVARALCPGDADRFMHYVRTPADSSLSVHHGAVRMPQLFAIGSGADAAMAALRAGARAQAAILAAAAQTVSVGDGVNWLDTSQTTWRIRGPRT